MADLENADVDGGYAAAPEITLKEMEQILASNRLSEERMHPHPDFEHSYLVEVAGEKYPMTFDRDVYDRNPEIGFLTYRQPVFEELLTEALAQP